MIINLPIKKELYDYNMLPESIIDTFNQSTSPLSDYQQMILTMLLIHIQKDILRIGLENIIKK